MQNDPPIFDKPESFDALIDAMTPEVHRSLQQAIELGRWPNGERLAPEQLELCLQAVIAWEARNELAEEEKTGYIDRTDLRKKTK